VRPRPRQDCPSRPRAPGRPRLRAASRAAWPVRRRGPPPPVRPVASACPSLRTRPPTSRSRRAAIRPFAPASASAIVGAVKEKFGELASSSVLARPIRAWKASTSQPLTSCGASGATQPYVRNESLSVGRRARPSTLEASRSRPPRATLSKKIPTGFRRNEPRPVTTKPGAAEPLLPIATTSQRPGMHDRGSRPDVSATARSSPSTAPRRTICLPKRVSR